MQLISLINLYDSIIIIIIKISRKSIDYIVTQNQQILRVKIKGEVKVKDLLLLLLYVASRNFMQAF